MNYNLENNADIVFCRGYTRERKKKKQQKQQ